MRMPEEPHLQLNLPPHHCPPLFSKGKAPLKAVVQTLFERARLRNPPKRERIVIPSEARNLLFPNHSQGAHSRRKLSPSPASTSFPRVSFT